MELVDGSPGGPVERGAGTVVALVCQLHGEPVGAGTDPHSGLVT